MIRSSDWSFDPETGCWVWQLSLMSTGYGQKKRNGFPPVLAHRLYYEHYRGSIPSGRQLDHLCRNRACVNPAHLEVVTNAENSRRGAKAVLTWADVHAIRASTEPRAVLAARFGVSDRQIGAVLHNETWHDPDYQAVERRAPCVTPDVAREMRASVAAGESRQALAERYGLDYSYVCAVIRGERPAGERDGWRAEHRDNPAQDTG